MQLHWRSTITLLSIGVVWQTTGALGQRFRVGEESMRPVIVDGATTLQDADNLPENAMVENIAVSDVPRVSEVPQISGIPQVDVNDPWESNSTAIPTSIATPKNPATSSQPQPTEPVVPIAALLFSGPPGPKDCRGTVMAKVQLPKPGSQHSTPTCYNVPGVAQCATFVANMDDGCQARLFNEPNCLTFSNLAVFTPEQKAVGGLLRSIEITCGIKGETPPPLNLPGLKLPPNAQQAVGK
ncbi:uncharacterized protein GGS22DRAFT_95933 [Annulohypoxylon maeteangense]|uniref:uncharacterized protein n=1 Tax=Annulohypoxylon maeteangense TaxID=1927788 RepID=UPI002008550E|nr:uncharacterized protein GGS22DRAFT_95933 [Annulohypoxylon maeteangense]KAI0888308.1 hypothetical protein GGS22DRAFT_95933 [Annulohypoxylon maeteangense]